jgi:hypothetical protein
VASWRILLEADFDLLEHAGRCSAVQPAMVALIKPVTGQGQCPTLIEPIELAAA